MFIVDVSLAQLECGIGGCRAFEVVFPLSMPGRFGPLWSPILRIDDVKPNERSRIYPTVTA